MYYVDWGDGSKILASGIGINSKPNLNNPHSFYHMYNYWEMLKEEGEGNSIKCGQKATVSVDQDVVVCIKDTDSCCSAIITTGITDNWGWSWINGATSGPTSFESSGGGAGTEVITEVGTTTDVGFISLGSHNGKLYAGTYTGGGGIVHIYNYDPVAGAWSSGVALNTGESIWDFASFNGDVYATSESNGLLFRSTDDGNSFVQVYDNVSSSTNQNNLGLDLFVLNNELYSIFVKFSGATQGPTLYRSNDGTSFSVANIFGAGGDQK